MGNPQRWIARLVLLLAVLTSTPASADCPAPSVREPAPVAAGDDLLITGHDFAAGCNDTKGFCTVSGPSPPERGITVELQGDGATVASVIVDADETQRLTARLPVPASTKPGTYFLLVSSSDPTVELVASHEVEILAP